MGIKIFGYIIALIGLVILVLSFIRDKVLKFLPDSINKNDLIVTGIITLLVGAVLAYSKKKAPSLSSVKHATVEVPIFEGSGTQRKIIGYQRAVA
jgi:hypothetical protein